MANGRQGNQNRLRDRERGNPSGRQGNKGQPDGINVASEVARAMKEDVNDKTFSTLSAEILVKQAQKIGKSLAQGGLKTTQIRKFLDAVNEIKSRGEQGKDDYKSRCILLKPRLAYAAGRQQEVKSLMTVLEPCIDKIQGKEDFTHFHRFVEAIVAYHRYYVEQD